VDEMNSFYTVRPQILMNHINEWDLDKMGWFRNQGSSHLMPDVTFLIDRRDLEF
jgi:hypothetical protein